MRLKLKEITERIAIVSTEMRTLYDAAETANKDLEGAELEKWNTLKAERDDLVVKEARAKARDELDRKTEGKPVEQRGGESVWALTNEQRMADYVKATTGQDAAGLSLGRAVAGVLTGNWKDAEAEHRVMGTGVNAQGGFFVPDPVSANVIDLARNVSVCIRAGALTIPMTGTNMNVVRVLTDPAANFRGEGITIAESDATFDSILMTPGSIAALVRVNAELMDDVPQFAAQLDSMLAAALALKLDFAGLYGTSIGPQATGIRNATGVQEVVMGANGATPTDYDKFLDLIAAVELANGAPTTLIWSPRTKQTMAKIKTGIASDLTKLEPPVDFAALTKLVSNQVSITETQGSSGVASTAFLGGFDNLAFAIRQNVTIEASRVSGTAFEKNQVMVRAIMRANPAVLRPALLGRLVGII